MNKIAKDILGDFWIYQNDGTWYKLVRDDNTKPLKTEHLVALWGPIKLGRTP